MRRDSLLRLLLLALLWGSSFLWIKIALDGLGPVQLALGRVALGAAFLLGLCLVSRLRLPSDRSLLCHLVLVSLVGNVVPFVLFGLGEQRIDSGLAGVLNATTPLWTVIFALLVRQEQRPSPVRVAGLAIGFAGTMLILAPWQSTGGSLAGMLMCIAGPMCYGASLVYMARYVLGRGLDPVPLAATQIGLASCWLLLATPVFEWQPIHLDPAVTVAVAMLGLLGTGYAFVLVNRLVTELGPTGASTVTYLLPVIAVLLGAIVLDEVLGLRVLAGMVVVLVGVMLVQRRPRPVTPDGGRRPSGTARTGSTAGSCAAPTTRASRPS